MTAADIAFFVYRDHIFLVQGAVVDWKDYPKLRRILNNVANDPRIAEYLKNRPQSSA